MSFRSRMTKNTTEQNVLRQCYPFIDDHFEICAVVYPTQIDEEGNEKLELHYLENGKSVDYTMISCFQTVLGKVSKKDETTITYSQDHRDQVELSLQEQFAAVKSVAEFFSENGLDAFKTQHQLEDQRQIVPWSQLLLPFVSRYNSEALRYHIDRSLEVCQFEGKNHDPCLRANLLPYGSVLTQYFTLKEILTKKIPLDIFSDAIDLASADPETMQKHVTETLDICSKMASDEKKGCLLQRLEPFCGRELQNFLSLENTLNSGFHFSEIPSKMVNSLVTTDRFNDFIPNLENIIENQALQCRDDTCLEKMAVEHEYLLTHVLSPRKIDALRLPIDVFKEKNIRNMIYRKHNKIRDVENGLLYLATKLQTDPQIEAHTALIFNILFDENQYFENSDDRYRYSPIDTRADFQRFCNSNDEVKRYCDLSAAMEQKFHECRFKSWKLKGLCIDDYAQFLADQNPHPNLFSPTFMRTGYSSGSDPLIEVFKSEKFVKHYPRMAELFDKKYSYFMGFERTLINNPASVIYPQYRIFFKTNPERVAHSASAALTYPNDFRQLFGNYDSDLAANPEAAKFPEYRDLFTDPDLYDKIAANPEAARLYPDEFRKLFALATDEDDHVDLNWNLMTNPEAAEFPEYQRFFNFNSDSANNAVLRNIKAPHNFPTEYQTLLSAASDDRVSLILSWNPEIGILPNYRNIFAKYGQPRNIIYFAKNPYFAKLPEYRELFKTQKTDIRFEIAQNPNAVTFPEYRQLFDDEEYYVRRAACARKSQYETIHGTVPNVCN